MDEGPLGEEEATRRLRRVVGGAPAPAAERPFPAGRPAQSSGQTGPGSPAAKASTIWWHTSSWYCTGGDFMK